RNDGVIGDGDAFGTDLRAAFRDVAVPNAMRILQGADAIPRVNWVHFERRGVHEMTRTDELVEHLVVAQDMADVLTQEAFDALPELLHAFDVHLLHPPRPIGCIRGTRLEPADALLRSEIPRDVCHQVADWWERTHRFDRDGRRQIELIEPRH